MKGFVFRLIPPRSDFALTMTDDERAIMLRHIAYWSDLVSRGTAIAFGPVGDAAGAYGLGIILVEDMDAAERVRDGDPVHASPHGFTTEITSMLSLVTAGGRFDAF